MNMSPHTLRFYAKSGSLDFVECDKNGVRIFKESDFEKLFMISSLKRAGMTINKIREFVKFGESGNATIARRLEMKTALKNDATLSEEMPPSIRKVKERIRRLSEDREQFYKDILK